MGLKCTASVGVAPLAIGGAMSEGSREVKGDSWLYFAKRDDDASFQRDVRERCLKNYASMVAASRA
jgi:hypothetical protein